MKRITLAAAFALPLLVGAPTRRSPRRSPSSAPATSARRSGPSSRRSATRSSTARGRRTRRTSKISSRRPGHGATATTQPEAVKGADIVVLAVPGNLAVQITQSLGDLSGKIILDPTNRREPQLAGRLRESRRAGRQQRRADPGRGAEREGRQSVQHAELDEDGRSAELGRARLDSDRRRRRSRARHGCRARQRHGARARRSRAAALREHARRDARDLGERARPRRGVQLLLAAGAAGAPAR